MDSSYTAATKEGNTAVLNRKMYRALQREGTGVGRLFKLLSVETFCLQSISVAGKDSDSEYNRCLLSHKLKSDHSGFSC